MHISLELLPTGGDRLEGWIVADDGRAAQTFSGTLDLLRVLEELQEAQCESDGTAPTPQAASHLEGKRPSC